MAFSFDVESVGVEWALFNWSSYNVSKLGNMAYDSNYSGTYVKTTGDTMTGDLNIEKNLDVTGNITGNQIYGGMHYHNYSGVQLDFTSGTEYYHFWFTESPHLNGFIVNNYWFWVKL